MGVTARGLQWNVVWYTVRVRLYGHAMPMAYGLRAGGG
jgi:hypothetical protein